MGLNSFLLVQSCLRAFLGLNMGLNSFLFVHFVNHVGLNSFQSTPLHQGFRVCRATIAVALSYLTSTENRLVPMAHLMMRVNQSLRS